MEKNPRALTLSRAAVRAGGEGRETKGGDEGHRACLEMPNIVKKTWREGLKKMTREGKGRHVKMEQERGEDETGGEKD